MKNDIKTKLERELSIDIESEVQVVYILSRIRKIIEIDGLGREFKVLKFYCNWALHSQIDDTTPIGAHLNFLREPHNNKFLDFTLFDNELLKFLKQYNLPVYICTDKSKIEIFKEFILEILLDTPLIIKKIEKEELMLVRHPRGGSVTFRLREIT